MRRLAMAAAGLTALALAQAPPRNAYRAAYQTWREAEPTIELDAAGAGTALEPRAENAAKAAAAFYTARAEFLSSATGVETQRFLERASQVPEAGLASPPILQRVLLPASQNVATLVTTFAGDPDPAIQRLRQALERERTAVEALNATIEQRQGATDALVAANIAVEDTAAEASKAFLATADARREMAEQARKEAAAWSTYYEWLSQGARGVAVSSTNPAAVAAPGAPVVASPKPFTAKPSITPVPLSRYVGGWTFPPEGVYLGAQPEFVELTVRESGGRVTGTLYAKFILPAGSTGDPYLRFDFEGDLQPERDQQFTLRTSEGASGTIQLIPGSVFNLIEVVFQTDHVENKVRGGNFILIKK